MIGLIRENSFTLKKVRSSEYPAETITDADYADNLVLLDNKPVQAESILHSVEQGAGGIIFHVNANKTEYMIV